jgi:hypothetical protein
MSAPQQQPARLPLRWPWAVGVGLTAGILLVWSFNLRAREGEGKPGEKAKEGAPAKAEKPGGAVAPLRQTMAGQMELMREMMKTLQNPAGPTPDDLFRLMDKMMPLLDAGSFDELLGADGGNASHVAQRLGVHTKPPTDDLVEQLNLPRDQGQLVLKVVHDSPAAAAGLKPSDILLEINDRPVPKTAGEFLRAPEGIKADVPVNVIVLRKGKKEEIKGLKLRESPPTLLPR